jgi:hypothetical protein
MLRNFKVDGQKTAVALGYLPGPYMNGVGDGVRTRDIQIHSLALYQLSYTHRCVRSCSLTMLSL